MANLDAAFGMRPLRHKSGAVYNGAVNKYSVAGDYAVALFVGDAVVRVAGGANTAVIQSVAGGVHPIGSLPDVEKCEAGLDKPITGVIVGFEATTDRELISGTASTTRVVLVADDPSLIHEIQCDGLIPVANIGLNSNLIFTNSGSTVTGLSGVEMDSSAEAVTGTFQLRILRVSKDTENQDLAAANTNFEVSVNIHTEADSGYNTASTNVGGLGI